MLADCDCDPTSPYPLSFSPISDWDGMFASGESSKAGSSETNDDPASSHGLTCQESAEPTNLDTPSDQPQGLSSPESSQWTGFKIVGDNVDKNVRPTLQLLTHQTKYLHHFHSYAVKDRVNLSSASDASKSCPSDLSSFVMSSQDWNWFKDTCQILVSRYILCTATFCLGGGAEYLAPFLRIIGYWRDVRMWGRRKEGCISTHAYSGHCISRC